MIGILDDVLGYMWGVRQDEVLGYMWGVFRSFLLLLIPSLCGFWIILPL